MKEIIIIRHAKSSWNHPGLADFDRPLNERGKRDAPKMGAFLLAKNLVPDLIFTSPANRAITTARVICNQLNCSEDSLRIRQSLYHTDLEDVLELIKSLDNSLQRIYLFGHNPTWTEVANYFSNTYIQNVPTCGIVHIVSESENWESINRGNSEVKNTFFPKTI